MSTVLLIASKRLFLPSGLVNGGEVFGTDSVTAAALVAAGSAAEYNAGSGTGTPTTSPFRGQGAGETNAQFVAAGGSSGNEKPSDATQGYQGSVTIVRGRAVPNNSVGDKGKG